MNKIASAMLTLIIMMALGIIAPEPFDVCVLLSVFSAIFVAFMFDHYFSKVKAGIAIFVSAVMTMKIFGISTLLIFNGIITFFLFLIVCEDTIENYKSFIIRIREFSGKLKFSK